MERTKMFLEELKPNLLIVEAMELFEREEPEAQSIQRMVSQLPKFPGTQLKKEIDSLIKSSADLLKDFAKKAKPFAQERGYRTQIFDVILDNPEKVAKTLIKKYASAYKADGMVFNLRDILKGVDLNLSK
jgi:hypothetical protein